MRIDKFITKVVVFDGKRCNTQDIVQIHTNLPLATWPYDKDGLCLQFKAACGDGAAYLKQHFDREPDEIILL